ncbi:hypothetical protein LCGC14_2665380 [marine sediment metagenome]|uniref:DNA methylase N-4/N-6 domain-containing protein n=1 Tax=marine sediment metagenome TaxID=412755 RepID=A0A0F9AD19_9ZZZZ
MNKLTWPQSNVVTCGEALDVLERLPDECIDLIATDPPYGISYKTSHRSPDSTCAREIRGDTIEEVLPTVKEVARVLKPLGALYWFTRFDVYPVWREEIARYLDVKTPLVWDKGNWSMGDLEGDYGNRTELVIYATKGRHILRGRRDHNLLAFMRPGSNRLHPHQKSQRLLEFLISKSSDIGDLVFDPFCGSGTTLIAAVKLYRKYLGVDVAPEYTEMSQRRIAKAVLERSQLKLGI